jgi:hypothetical protein
MLRAYQVLKSEKTRATGYQRLSTETS